MRTRFLRGDTTQNNGLTLPAGEIAIDTEKHAVRLHDGQTLGGFEIVGNQVIEPPPGPQSLIGGDTTAGFYGEVGGGELITYGELATTVGLSSGVLQHDAESAWLKFALDGGIIFVAKKPARHTISWNTLNASSLVSGSTTITIGSLQYKVRLLKGANTDPTDWGDDGLWKGYDIDLTHGSEWNRLMYPIHSGVHTDASNPTAASVTYNQWANYSDGDLLVHHDFGDGRIAWTQETSGGDNTQRTGRGPFGITYLHANPSTAENSNFGWRPVLELVQ